MKIIDLGLKEYSEVYRLQQELLQERLAGGGEDTLYIVQHPPVITVGRGSKPGNLLVSEHELASRGIELVKVERGGNLMLHCPGQLVAYPVLGLKGYGLGLKQYMRKLEQVMFAVLQDFGIKGESRQGYTGAWVAGKKIGFAGVAVKEWVSYHGLALNVNPELSLFDLLVSCGIKGVQVTSIQKLSTREVGIQEVAEKVGEHFMEVIEVKSKKEKVKRNSEL